MGPGTSDHARAERSWLALALGLEATLVAADVAVGPLAGTFVLAPLLLAAVASPRLTAVGGLAAVTLTVLSGAWNDGGADAGWTVRIMIVSFGSALAVYAAVRRTRGEASVRALRSLDAVTDVVRAAPAAVIGLDPRGTVTLWNPAAERVFGFAAEDAVGRELADLVVPPALRGRHRQGLARIRNGEPSRIVGHEVELPALRADGSEVPVRLHITRLTGTGATAFAGHVHDITEERHRERAQRLLAGTANLLASSTDVERTVREIPRLAVPELAVWCGLDLPGARGLELAALARSDEDLEVPRRRHPLVAAAVLEQVAETGEAVLDPSGRAMVIPLRGGRRTIGTLSFVAPDGAAGYDAADLALAEELGRRAGTALENARLYRERSEVAQTLAAGLRPAPLPPMPGWQAAALYAPADRVDEVGGDFYDVIPVRGGWMLVIGDVIGKGPSAAALTALARASLRTAATLTTGPAAALAHLNDDLLREGQGGIISAAGVHLREVPGGAEAVVASGGHPLPVLVRDGEPRTVGAPSLLLGVATDATFREEVVPLVEGDDLVLYTDGVPDAQGLDQRFGDDRLLDALRGTTESPEELVARVTAPLDAFQHGPQRDDMALLAVRRHAGLVPLRRQAGA